MHCLQNGRHFVFQSSYNLTDSAIQSEYLPLFLFGMGDWELFHVLGVIIQSRISKARRSNKESSHSVLFIHLMFWHPSSGGIISLVFLKLFFTNVTVWDETIDVEDRIEKYGCTFCYRFILIQSPPMIFSAQRYVTTFLFNLYTVLSQHITNWQIAWSVSKHCSICLAHDLFNWITILHKLLLHVGPTLWQCLGYSLHFLHHPFLVGLP